MTTIKVIAKCVSCGDKREIKAGEVPKGGMPMCDKCGFVMIAEESTIKEKLIE